jgi:hypothetical protein
MKPTDQSLGRALRFAFIREWICEWLMEWNSWLGAARIGGVGLVGLWAWLIFWKIKPEDGVFAAACIALPAFASLLLGTIMIVPSLVRCPVLTYDVAERLKRERRWEDAAAEFERLAYWHPTEARAWNEAIWCTIQAGDTFEAARLYKRARLICSGVHQFGTPD